MAKTLAQGRKPGSGRKPGKGKTLREGRKPGSGRRRRDPIANNITNTTNTTNTTEVNPNHTLVNNTNGIIGNNTQQFLSLVTENVPEPLNTQPAYGHPQHDLQQLQRIPSVRVMDAVDALRGLTKTQPGNPRQIVQHVPTLTPYMDIMSQSPMLPRKITTDMSQPLGHAPSSRHFAGQNITTNNPLNSQAPAQGQLKVEMHVDIPGNDIPAISGGRNIYSVPHTTQNSVPN